MRNILVVSPNWLGDVVFSTPVYRALKQRYPCARLSVLAVPRVKEVLELCPDVDEVVVHDERAGLKGLFVKMMAGFALRSKHFDAAFILRRSASRSFMAWLAGIPVRAGFGDGSWRWLLTHVVDPAGCDTTHRSDVYSRVIESFGIRVNDRSGYLDVGRDVREGMAAKLRGKGIADDVRIVVLNTGGNWGLKQWPQKFFTELAARLVSEIGVKVVLSGSLVDMERVRLIAKDSGVDPVVLAGETNIKELAALFKRAFWVVSADSGPLHLANAVGANVIALFGPTQPDITGPRGQGRIKILRHDVACNRKPCYVQGCLDNKCMKAITVDDVIQTFKVLKS